MSRSTAAAIEAHSPEFLSTIQGMPSIRWVEPGLEPIRSRTLSMLIGPGAVIAFSGQIVRSTSSAAVESDTSCSIALAVDGPEVRAGEAAQGVAVVAARADVRLREGARDGLVERVRGEQVGDLADVPREGEGARASRVCFDRAHVNKNAIMGKSG